MDDRQPAPITPDAARSEPSRREPNGRRWIISIFGDVTRSGSWPPGRRLSPFALFGDIDLDLRQASMPEGDVVISAIAPFGNIDVLVPQGAQVDVGGFTLFGSKKVAVGESPTGGVASLIRVRGVSLFGSLKVWSA